MSDLAYIERQLEDMLKILSEIRDNTKPKVRSKPIKQTEMDVNSGAYELVKFWTLYAHSDFAKVVGMSPKSLRYRQANDRWTEKPDPEYWRKVIEKMNTVKFFHGDNDRKWVADFEFFVRPDNHARILEGKFDKLHKSFGNEKKERQIMGYSESGEPVYG